MSVYTMVVAIVLIVTIGRIYRDRQKLRLRGEAGQAMVDSAETQRLKNEVTRLNERIQVLERLATDPAKRLADEIDGLAALPASRPTTISKTPSSKTQETDDAQR